MTIRIGTGDDDAFAIPAEMSANLCAAVAKSQSAAATIGAIFVGTVQEQV